MEKRIIKFRAWTGGEMLYNVLPVNDSAVITDMQGFGPSAEVLYRHDIISIMQFTGFKDCKEKDIYEGDYIQGQGVVSMQFGCWVTQTEYLKKNFGEKLGDYPVIGNIYEDPELLLLK